MPFYWSLKSIPELAPLPKARRLAIWKACYPGSFKLDRLFLGQWLALMVVYSGPSLFGFRLWNPGFNWLGFGFLLSIQTVVGYFVALVFVHLRIVAALPEIRKRVGGLCLQCGYDLTGNTSGICPECGTPIPVKAGEESRRA
jgi:hypothetical protein